MRRLSNPDVVSLLQQIPYGNMNVYEHLKVTLGEVIKRTKQQEINHDHSLQLGTNHSREDGQESGKNFMMSLLG